MSSASIADQVPTETPAESTPPANDQEDADCTICLDKITKRGIISCSHKFCHACILDWSKVTNECPVCKKKFTSVCEEAPPGPPEYTKTGKRKAPKKGKVTRVRNKIQRVSYGETGFGLLHQRQRPPSPPARLSMEGIGFWNMLGFGRVMEPFDSDEDEDYAPEFNLLQHGEDEDEDMMGLFAQAAQQRRGVTDLAALISRSFNGRAGNAPQRHGRVPRMTVPSSSWNQPGHPVVVDLVDSSSEDEEIAAVTSSSSAAPRPAPTEVVVIDDSGDEGPAVRRRRVSPAEGPGQSLQVSPAEGPGQSLQSEVDNSHSGADDDKTSCP